MAAIALSDCTISGQSVGAQKIYIIVTPATADAGDTIDVSSIFDVGCHSTVSSTTTLAPTLAADLYAAKNVTLPAGATNEAHTITAIGQ